MKAIAEPTQLPGESNRQYEKRLGKLATSFLKERHGASKIAKARRKQRDKTNKAHRLERQKLMQFDLLPGVQQLENAASLRLGYPVIIALKSEDDPQLANHVELRVNESQFKMLAIYLWFTDENGIPYRRNELGHKQSICPGVPVPFQFVNGCSTDFRRENLFITPRRPRGMGKNNKGRTKKISLSGFNGNFNEDTLREQLGGCIRSAGLLGDSYDD
jgi:hypothetical protein